MPNFYDEHELPNPTDRAYEGVQGVQDEFGRRPFEKDRDRILYSSAFRRLAGVTQTSAVNERRLLHNRLTHSLKVAQIGKRIANRLARPPRQRELAEAVGLDADIVEAAGLAHDLGHPPFGHTAEEVLNELLKDHGGFEGNAQTFRILTKLSVRRQPPHSRGLDLTRATLNGVLKYPRLRPVDPAGAGAPWTDRSVGRKWGAFETEKADLDFARRGSQGEIRSANAIVMDWADDIAFATHDLDDYFRSGMIPLDSLTRDEGAIMAHAGRRLSGYPEFSTYEFSEAFKRIAHYPGGPFTGSRSDRYEIHHFISDVIKRCVDAVSIWTDSPQISIDSDVQYEVEVLKELTWFYVIESPSLAVLQEGQRRMIADLYWMVQNWLSGGERRPVRPGNEEDVRVPRSPSFRTPAPLQSIVKGITEDRAATRESEETKRSRAVCDYICTLTEDQALDMYERFAGTYRGSLFGAWFSS
ncbi:dNTP triphosphohydrolase [Streptomyces sp. HP-A2021]|uniref:deoxyguanosinetriphosphate triphosphohydrolase family protein n=1 Tax=Streptomyces sp. HP-A2021 TaxID=2927875 RepID=UPI001FAF5E90|nr:dNTP triphosphohydrolase [Streptomyces sp. HP-A2021]UOB12831.1 dNTP triphosphohydrolase [Streptomyces sp. HP-A2021]